MERNIISITQSSTRYMRMLTHHCFSFFFLFMFLLSTITYISSSQRICMHRIISDVPLVFSGVSYV